MRIPYTEHDDEMLAYNVAKYHGGRKDMEAIFRRLGKKVRLAHVLQRILLRMFAQYPEHSAARCAGNLSRAYKLHYR